MPLSLWRGRAGVGPPKRAAFVGHGLRLPGKGNPSRLWDWHPWAQPRVGDAAGFLLRVACGPVLLDWASLDCASWVKYALCG